MQGQFELNVRIPLIARNLLQSIHLLTSAASLLRERCVEGLEPNVEALTRHGEATLATATALNPYIGYDRAAEIVKEAASSGRPLRDVAREKGVEEATLERALDLAAMARPHG
jgi:fumarate hydratase, class II